MPIRNSPHAWGGVAKTLHWGIAALVVALVLLGLFMQELPNSPFKLRMYALHKSLGLTALALVLLRLLWRLIDRRPAWPASMPAWERRLAGIGHGLLYLVLLVMPISGWLYNSASNFPLRWFNLVRIPPLAEPDPELKALALAMHQWAFYALALLLAVHVGAALKHHFHDRDSTLRRMLPFSKARDGAG